MKKIIFLICFLTASSIVYFTYKNFIKPVVIKNSVSTTSNNFSYEIKGEKNNFEEITDWYEAKIEYPKNNKTVTDKVFQSWADFAKETDIKKYTNLKDAKEGLGINADGLKYSYIASFAVATSSEYLTYVYAIYNFTGGPHGSTIILPVTLNRKGEPVESKIFLPDDKLKKIAELSTVEIKKQKIERLKSSGMTDKEVKEFISSDNFMSEGVKPTRENYSVVYPEADNLVIVFGQYQVGSYAEGIYTVKIPVKDI